MPLQFCARLAEVIQPFLRDETALREHLRSAAMRALSGGREFGMGNRGSPAYEQVMQRAKELSIQNRTNVGNTGAAALLGEYLGQDDNAQGFIDSLRHGYNSPQYRKIYGQGLEQAKTAYNVWDRDHPSPGPDSYLNLLNYIVAGPGGKYLY